MTRIPGTRKHGESSCQSPARHSGRVPPGTDSVDQGRESTYCGNRYLRSCEKRTNRPRALTALKTLFSSTESLATRRKAATQVGWAYVVHPEIIQELRKALAAEDGALI